MSVTNPNANSYRDVLGCGYPATYAYSCMVHAAQDGETRKVGPSRRGVCEPSDMEDPCEHGPAAAFPKTHGERYGRWGLCKTWDDGDVSMSV